MSIQNRLEDAKCLIEQGRYEGALTSLLIAVAATARKRFPKGVTPSIADPKKKMGDKMMQKMKADSLADLVRTAVRLGLAPARNPWHTTEH